MKVKLSFSHYEDEKGERHSLGVRKFGETQFTLRQHNANAYMALAKVRRLTPHFNRTGGKR